MTFFDQLDLDPTSNPVRMGTRSLGQRPWLIADDNKDDELAIKRNLLAEQRDEVLVTTDRCLEAAAELAELVGIDPGDLHPLEAAALAAQEDFALLRRGIDGWHLDSACVCFPSHWRLKDKVGRHIAAVHGPVDDYDPLIADRVDRLFDRLTDRPVWRRNWFLEVDPTLHQPTRIETDTLEDGVSIGDQLWFRSERQTLRLLTSGWIVFTIRVQQMRMREAVTSPERVHKLREWTVNASDDIALHHHLGPRRRDALQRWLDTQG